ncbi:MAG: acyltransferase family protein [Ruminococcus sp.]|nr:acyltransferase family protein [Ruminococcus sp.]
MLWTTFYSLISISGVVRDGTSIDWLAYALNFITGGASAPLYYIICLLQFTLLTPLLLKAVEKKGAVDKILWLISFAYLFFIYVCFAIIPDSYFMSGTIRGLFFPAWMLFYYLGLNTKANNLAVNGLADRFGKFRFVFIAFVLECIESVIVLKCGGNSGLATGLFKISSFLYAFSICLLCMNLAHRNQEGENNLQRVLHHIGDRSYGIFYIHCFILMFVRKFSSLLFEDIWILNFIICFIMTALLSVLAVDIVNVMARKLKIETALKWIGFERSI